MLRHSLKATLLLLTALLLAPRLAAAQGPGDTNIFGGYSFMHDLEDSTEPNFPAGFEAGFNHRLNGAMPIMTIGAKVQASWQTLDTAAGPDTESFSATSTLFGVTFGPPPDAAKKVWFFGSAYLGVTHLKEDFLGAVDTANYFTFQPGGGLGLFVTPNVGVQVTAELPIVSYPDSTATAFRLSASVSVRLR